MQHLYSSCPIDVIVSDLKLPPFTARYGLLRKSRIISNAIDRKTKGGNSATMSASTPVPA